MDTDCISCSLTSDFCGRGMRIYVQQLFDLIGGTVLITQTFGSDKPIPCHSKRNIYIYLSPMQVYSLLSWLFEHMFVFRYSSSHRNRMSTVFRTFVLSVKQTIISAVQKNGQPSMIARLAEGVILKTQKRHPRPFVPDAAVLTHLRFIIVMLPVLPSA